MGILREPTIEEVQLLDKLIENASIDLPLNWKSTLKVKPMNDGDMGSLLLFPNRANNCNRIFGEQISEYQYKDIDGVDIIASLNIDSNGSLFELDIWKTDFSPTKKIF